MDKEIVSLEYKKPTIDLLDIDEEKKIDYEIDKNEIEKFFRQFGVYIECKDAYRSINTVTYVIDLKVKTRTKTIQSYKNDLLFHFGGDDVDFINAINGTTYYGICIRRNTNDIYKLGNAIQSNEFKSCNAKLPLIFGKSVMNTLVVQDLVELPHLLIAGTVKTGKSSLLSSFIIEMLYKLSPDDVRLVLIDTRKTNFFRFDNVPHLLIPTINDYQKAAGILEWAIDEMNRRYRKFNNLNVDNIDSYNKYSEEKYPRIVVMIEDFSDLMKNEMGNDIREKIKRLIQMSRAAGIHLILSTQRPSVDVITGTIKENIPSRITFNVPAQVDSRTIIDVAGAEKLFIYGDILYKGLGRAPIRLQVPYCTDEEVERVVEWIKENNADYNEINEQETKEEITSKDKKNKKECDLRIDKESDKEIGYTNQNLENKEEKEIIHKYVLMSIFIGACILIILYWLNK